MNKSQSPSIRQHQLTEMPELFGSSTEFSKIIYDSMKDAVNKAKLKNSPVDLSNISQGLKKIYHDGEVLYWYEDEKGEIQLGVMMRLLDDDKLRVSLLTKNLEFKNKPPYALDLYLAILKDNVDKKILSDASVSKDAFHLWINLFNRGYVTSVYDNEDKKEIKINNIDEFNKFTGADSKIRYQYILSNPKPLEEVQRLAQLAGVAPKS